MTKSVEEFSTKRIVFETSVPVDEVVARLDKELNSDKAWPHLFELLEGVKTREELERGFLKVSEGRDFVYVLFGKLPLHEWRNAYLGATDGPKTYQYSFGNPPVAQPMLQLEPYATLHVPLRMLVLEKEDKTGTEIVYMQPSISFGAPRNGKVDEELRAMAEEIDDKVESLVRRVISA
ncbi:uncharacterized protein LAESUDRAFT_694236 [Laetiporus sulphureus 93-53]|uniref:DUF302 domain-containing protein n=1 Tax=Laetiporus sulphureus 93-53 TaxID=1314785 RepID=A0A165GMX1_9APHY|nr:uncharacterized protein LAESUDRAFT_694236 [Laetiporus sulphureus 93-53]KZT10569.1 hypothetical protein LAESUDRAFT_694236 [Laetiporus sulphureus 93-53]